MNFFGNPGHDKMLRQWINSQWGISRLYRRMKLHYRHHGATLILRAILHTASQEGRYYARNSILRVMRIEDFDSLEKNSMLKWVDGLEPGCKYGYCREYILSQKRENTEKVSGQEPGEDR